MKMNEERFKRKNNNSNLKTQRVQQENITLNSNQKIGLPEVRQSPNFKMQMAQSATIGFSL